MHGLFNSSGGGKLLGLLFCYFIRLLLKQSNEIKYKGVLINLTLIALY